MDISSIQQFLVLAKTLNFTRAAEKCFVTQPTLSRNIANLERELGITLFSRSKKAVAITPEGEQLQKHAYRILEEYEQILALTSHGKKEVEGIVNVGYSSYPYMLSVCMDAEAQLCQQFPEIKVQVTFGGYHENFLLLLDDQLDGIFTLDCILQSYPELSWLPVAPCRYCVLLSNNHPLSKQESVSLHELEGVPFIMVGRESNPELFDFRFKLFTDHGISPQNIIYADSVKELMVMVSREQGIAILNEDGHINTIESIKPVWLSDPLPPVQVAFTWKKKKDSACVGRFADVLRSIHQNSR